MGENIDRTISKEIFSYKRTQASDITVNSSIINQSQELVEVHINYFFMGDASLKHK